jgi:hypothetical protein
MSCSVAAVIDPKREPNEHDDARHVPDGPHEIEDAAAQELAIPSDESEEG